jgi:hypothetical protein
MSRLRVVLVVGALVLLAGGGQAGPISSSGDLVAQQPPAPQQPTPPNQPPQPPPHYPLPGDPKDQPREPGRDPSPPTAEPRRDDAAHAQKRTEGAAPADCKAMMAERQQLMAQQEEMDTRLHALLIQMNAAEGVEGRLSALTTVVNELVGQRLKTRSQMAEMQQRMMAHMGQHMQSGDMAKCPMMKMPGHDHQP